MTQTISLEAVGLELGGRHIVHDLTVTLEAHRIAVIGANGSGKSTLLRLLDGLVPPTTGTISVHGIDPAHEARRLHRHVGFIFTNPDAQIVMPTAREDLAFSLRGVRDENGRRLDRAVIAERVDTWLTAHGLADHADSSAHTLSGGQKQLLAIGAVLIREPGLVLADEPTTMLDLPNARLVGDLLIDELTQPVVIATHDLELAARCDVAVRFARGTITRVGDPAELIAEYRAEFA